MPIHRLFSRLAFLAAFLLPAALHAQVDIIRGRVVGPDSQPLVGVSVTATTLTGNVSRIGRTDKNGRYQISFPGGEGDYWVNFASLGFSPRRYQVKRTADQEILIADARMAIAAVNLEAFQVQATRVVARNDTVSDVSGSEKTVDPDPGLLSVDQLGDLVAMVSAIPGVQLIPGVDGGADAFSVFGLSGDQNNTQLNGLNFGDATVPRDAQVSTSLSTSPYDVSRGGFSGGQLQIRTGGSGSNFVRRNLSTNFQAPQLQFVDRAGVATGQQFTRVSLGGSSRGPIKMDQLFFNGSFQYDRTLQDLQTLLNTNALGLETNGIAPDSVSRLISILGTQDVPFNVAAATSQRISDRGSGQLSIDWVQPNSIRGNAFSFSLLLNGNRTQPTNAAGGGNFGGGGGGFGGAGGGGGFGTALATPTRFGTTSSLSATAQLRHSGQLGFAGIFTESNVGFSQSRNNGNPFLDIPTGSVRVSSALSDGTVTSNSLGFGGSPGLNTSSGSQSLAGLNTMSWFSSDNRHRVKFTTELRRDWYSADQTNNQLGTFTYNSLSDLQANIPASFTRQLSPRTRTGSQLVGALSLGDAWRPISDVQIQYGVRMDGNKYLYGPAANPDVDAKFGITNTDVPSRLYFSPRLGFSWTYGTASQVALAPGMIRAPRAVIRGGVGIFQNTPGVQLIGGAIDNTGLPSGIQTLTCIGAATPIPNWSEYLVNQGAIPTTCADGTNGTVFANSSPNVTVFDPDFAAQRSIRGNLQWSGAVLDNRFSLTADATMSRNEHQQSNVDLNFLGNQFFTLAAEGGRPVYVAPSAIVPTTGQVAFRQSRVDTTYGRVTLQQSDRMSNSKQLSLSVRPLTFNSKLSWSASYVLSDVDEQYNGFSSTVGNPFTVETSPGNFSRHQIQLSLGYNFFNTVRVSMGANVRSGTRYTPTISGDVNGDSYGNDRAFIFDPSNTADPVVAAGIQSLLDNGTREASSCLRSQLGQLASRNSCTGPWFITNTNLNLSFNSINLGLPQRANLRFTISNALSGLDRLVNGNDQKGWGQQINPSQQLLFARGFDPATNRFRYEVNERFGSTRLSQVVQRQMVQVQAYLNFDIGPTRERQQLIQQLDRGRSRPGNRPNVQQLRGSANVGILNPMQQILSNADTLQLTRRQADSLVALNRKYVLKSDSVWAPVARLLAELPDRYDHDLAYDRYREARIETVDMLIQFAPLVKGLLSPSQYRILPTTVAGFLDKRTLQGIRAGTSGGF